MSPVTACSASGTNILRILYPCMLTKRCKGTHWVAMPEHRACRSLVPQEWQNPGPKAPREAPKGCQLLDRNIQMIHFNYIQYVKQVPLSKLTTFFECMWCLHRFHNYNLKRKHCTIYHLKWFWLYNIRTLNQFINLWIKHDQILISKFLIPDPIREFWSHGLAAEFYMQGLRELVDPGAKDLEPRNFTGVSQGTYLTAMIPKRIMQITEPNTSPTCN